jgi:hypothetical protein
MDIRITPLCPFVWRILHEQSLYPYHIQPVQAITPPDHHARVEFCQWLLAECTANTQPVANILFTEEAELTRDSTLNFHNTHIWVDDNHHTTTITKYQH